MIKDYNLISPTATLCAKARADYTEMPYAREMYEEISPVIAKKNILGGVFPIIRGISKIFPNSLAKSSVLEGRYLSTNDALKRLGDFSILEIAAGLSPRSLEFAKGNLFYMETDLPDMIKLKEEIVKNVRKRKGEDISPNHYSFSLNPVNKDELDNAGRLYTYKGDRKPLAIIHEGLFMYLNRKEQKEVRDNFRDFLQEYSPNGAWITPDLSYQLSKDNLIVKLAKRRIQKRTGREFSRFNSNEEIDTFLKEGDLKRELLPNSHLIPSLSCIEKRNLNPDKVKEIADDYRASFITLR